MTLLRGTSRWGRPIAERWLATWAHDPVLVAESLRRLPDPLELILTPEPRPDPGAVVAAMAQALRSPLAEDAPPAWLRDDQVTAFRRALAAVRRHRGALLAESVGSGKSWIALAVATAMGDGPIVVLAPAALVAQWRALGERLGLTVVVHSHEAISRGRLPSTTEGFILIDESHRFRHPGTRRYRALAPWLIGRHGLLISATPVVNHPRDAAHQLRLFLRDDALAPFGLASLRGLEASSVGLEALGEVIVAGHTQPGARPALESRALRPRLDLRLGRILRELDRLGLSTDPGIAALVRTSLWGAAASSPAALAAALLRYLALLDHAADAARSGQALTREALRGFLAADAAQLVFWELLPTTQTVGDLVLADREAVSRLRADAARCAEEPDPKLTALRRLLADGHTSLVFTGALATVAYLRRRLEPEPVAWCTGARAGIGSTVLARDSVLAWFTPDVESRRPVGLRSPRILVTTDVAAEGLDLQAASRVIHYDLPWTAIRAEQRTGRVRRLGSRHAGIEERWLLPPRTLARRLGVEGILASKRGLPTLLGVGDSAATHWRRRQAALRNLPAPGGAEGITAVSLQGIGEDDALACVRIGFPDGSGATRLQVHSPRTGWRTDEPGALEFLTKAAEAPSGPLPSADEIHALVESLAPVVRRMLREASGRSWEPERLPPSTAILLRRLRHWARIAARARDARLMERLDNAVRGLGQGMTAGEELQLARLAQRQDAGLQEHLAALPSAAAGVSLPVVRLVGVVVRVVSEK